MFTSFFLLELPVKPVKPILILPPKPTLIVKPKPILIVDPVDPKPVMPVLGNNLVQLI